MRKYWFYGILAMVCLVLLAGLSIRARAEMAGVTVTAVLEKDAPGSSPGPSDDAPDEEPNDDSDDNPDGEPDNDSDGNPDGEPDDDSEENSGGTKDVSEEDDNGEVVRNPGSESEESDGEPEPGENESLFGKLIRMIPIVVALIGTGILGGVTGLWAYLWMLFTWYLLKSRRKKWHGILTDEENRFIEINPATDDYQLAQEIIDYSLNPADALRTLEETGDLTYLPGSCKVWVSYWMDGTYRTEKVRCNESKVYEMMAGLGDVGNKQVVIENRRAGFRIVLQYP